MLFCVIILIKKKQKKKNKKKKKNVEVSAFSECFFLHFPGCRAVCIWKSFDTTTSIKEF